MAPSFASGGGDGGAKSTMAEGPAKCQVGGVDPGVGARQRRAHGLRRTGISLAIEDGAEELILKRGTHAPPRHVMALYTSVQWKTLCREVAKLAL